MYKNEPIMKITKSVEFRKKKILIFFSINHGYAQVCWLWSLVFDNNDDED